MCVWWYIPLTLVFRERWNVFVGRCLLQTGRYYVELVSSKHTSIGVLHHPTFQVLTLRWGDSVECCARTVVRTV